MMSNSWATKPLNKLVTLSSGKFLPTRLQKKGRIPVYGGNGITGWHDEHMIEKPTIVFGRVGEYCGSVHLTKGKSWITDNAILTKEIDNMVEVEFLYHYLSWLNINLLAEVSGQPKITQDILKNIIVRFPKDKKEQKKIASIFLLLDSIIGKTKKVIEANKKLKKGLIQNLLTTGIRHSKFKTENLGTPSLNVTIPAEWGTEQIGKIFKTIENPITLEDSKKYTRLTVKRNNVGIVFRDRVFGKEILVTKQHSVRAGDFIISNKQIIHRACGVIPKDHEGSVVSIEYTMLRPSNQILVEYMNLFSHTDLFKKMIIITTQGVHIEKYVFLVDEWLSFKIPLPPIEEQRKIVKIISNVEEIIKKEENHESHLKNLKKGLIKKILSGQIRIKI